MSKAFEEACNVLQVFTGDEKGREIIATRIIDLARGGVIDAAALLIASSLRRALANREATDINGCCCRRRLSCW